MTASTRGTTWMNRAKHIWPFSRVYGALSVSHRARLRRLVARFSRPAPADRLTAQVSQTNDLLALLAYERIRASPRAQDACRLLGHGFKVYSQHDEDGIIQEIFQRIGVSNRYFVEFGVGDGLENCTLYLMLQGWRGAWIDGSAYCYEEVCRNLRFAIDDGQLRVLHSFITAENIEDLLAQLGVPAEFDFLSIDIDRNDYWVWRAIARHRPRVVAIEYNASFRHTVACVVPYEPTAIWDLTNYYGASLKALQLLGEEKGYRLVGCNATGVTAFFVRADLVGNAFAAPFTSENHYEAPTYFLRMPNGHAPAYGPMVSVEKGR